MKRIGLCSIALCLLTAPVFSAGCDDDHTYEMETWADIDRDGYGNPEMKQVITYSRGDQIPEGFVEGRYDYDKPYNADCDDTNPSINPGVEEVCDGIDNDCYRGVDNGFPQAWAQDADEDGYYDADTLSKGCTKPESEGDWQEIRELDPSWLDCNSDDSNIHPRAEEVCDGIDNDCDGTVDEGTWYLDRDKDGHGDSRTAVDNCEGPTERVKSDKDCNDDDAGINPSVSEVCDGIDQDCDDDVDEGTVTIWYRDGDGDGYGSKKYREQCTPPSGYVGLNTDCNDSDSGINPGISEVCDGIDNDCDGSVDEGLTTTYVRKVDDESRPESITGCSGAVPPGYRKPSW